MFQAGFFPRQNQVQRYPNVWEMEDSGQPQQWAGYNGEARRVFSFDDERLVTTVSNYRQHQQQPEPEQDLPDKIYDNSCSLVLVNDFLECGVIQLRGSRGQTANCLFLRRDVLVMGRREKLSYELARDGCYRANAWLINPCSKIPYLAANVWFDGAQNIPPSILRRISSRADEDSLHVYNRVVNDLIWDLPDQSEYTGDTQRNVVLVDRDEEPHQAQPRGRDLGRQVVFRGEEEQDSEDRAWSHHTNRRVQVWEKSPPKITRNVTITPWQTHSPGATRQSQTSPHTSGTSSMSRFSGGRSRSTSSERSSGQEKNKRSRSKRSRKRSRNLEERRVVARSPPRNKILDQLIFENCTTARVSSYLGNGIGVLSIRRGTERRKEDRQMRLEVALFHVDQVWTRTPGLGLHQQNEVYRSREVESQYRVGATVYCNVRKIEAKDADCQAVFVGKSSEDYKAWLQLVSGLEDSSPLARSLDDSRSLFSLREARSDGRSDGRSEAGLELLGGQPEVCEATVKEYVSLDYGLLDLSLHQAGTVLFNLSHVYLPADNCWKRLKTSQLLRDNFPVGMAVDVLITSIPCHQYSDLRYQALAVFKKSYQNIENPMKYFQSKYDSVEEKLELKKSLSRHFDSFKSFVNLQTHPKNALFSPVHVVLDCLPDSWQAVVVAEISKEFGIIRICKKGPGNISLPSGKSLKLLNVLFHIEDVFCEDGEKAVRKNVALGSLLNRSVHLTARSICSQGTPDGIFELIEKMLSRDGSLVGVPVLQAVTVCLGPARTSPRPTFLRKQTPSFVSPLFYCFLEFGLKTSLDIKLVQFLAEPKKPPLPYKEHFIKSYDYKKEKSVVEDLKAIDTETSIKIIYGSLKLKNIDNSIQESLPQNISRIDCRVLFLYRTNLRAERGVVLVKPLVENSAVECLAYFQYSDVHKQRPSDTICKDLATLMPCCSQDKYCVSLQLHDPKSPIPYLATRIWNETVRLEDNLPEPTVNISIDAYNVKSRNSFIKSMIATCPSQPETQQEKKQNPAPICEKQKQTSDINNGKKPEDPGAEFAEYVEKVSSKTLLVGKVLKVINSNYAVAVCVLPSKKTVQVLFDVFDVWNCQDGDCDVLANQKKMIKDVMSAGDFLRLHAIQIKSQAREVQRPISHMATAVIVAKTFEDLKEKQFPEDAVVLHSLDGVEENKVQNFEQVVKIMESIEMDHSEREIVADLVNMFEGTEKTEERPQKSLKKENIKDEKVDETAKKLDVNQPGQVRAPRKKKIAIVESNECETFKKMKIESNEEGKSDVVNDIKKEIEVAVEDMLVAAAEVRECYRLNNPGP